LPQNSRPKKSGRPRSEAAERAILQATVELLQEVGLTRMTIEAVAARAGVGRPTIYRRWSSKEAMAVAAVLAYVPPVPRPTVDDPITALHEIVPKAVEQMTDPRIRRIALEVLAACADDPELARTYRGHHQARREVSLELIRRAVETGRLRADVDPELLLDKITGPPLYRFFLAGTPPMPEHELHNLIDEVCDAARPRHPRSITAGAGEAADERDAGDDGSGRGEEPDAVAVRQGGGFGAHRHG
jgi:AcrR family transcriptional regulator